LLGVVVEKKLITKNTTDGHRGHR